jgi:hypothetical protein
MNRDENEFNGDIPLKLKWTLTAINRVGFPILAFLIMTYLCYVSLNRNTDAIAKLTAVVERLADRIDAKSLR